MLRWLNNLSDVALGLFLISVAGAVALAVIGLVIALGVMLVRAL